MEDKVKTSIKHLIYAIFGYGTLALMTGSLLLVAFWMFYPYKTITHSPQPYKLYSDTVVQGGYVAYDYSYCKYSDVPETVSKQFVDGLIYQSSDIPTLVPMGCGKVHKEINVPRTLPAGKYQLVTTAVFRVNPIRDITVITKTEWFTVVDTTVPGRN